MAVGMTRGVFNQDDVNGRVEQAIRELLQMRPWPPTVREIAKKTALPLATVHESLNRLRRAGRVDWVDGRTRTLHVPGPTPVIDDTG
jgi:DNA-binding transcriptional regulator YhcF (GntR family)